MLVSLVSSPNPPSSLDEHSSSIPISYGSELSNSSTSLYEASKSTGTGADLWLVRSLPFHCCWAYCLLSLLKLTSEPYPSLNYSPQSSVKWYYGLFRASYPRLPLPFLEQVSRKMYIFLSSLSAPKTIASRVIVAPKESKKVMMERALLIGIGKVY